MHRAVCTVATIVALSLAGTSVASANSCEDKKTRSNPASTPMTLIVKNSTSMTLTTKFARNDDSNIKDTAYIAPGAKYSSRISGDGKLRGIVMVDEIGAWCSADIRNGDSKTVFQNATCNDSVKAPYTVTCDRNFQAPENKQWKITFEFTESQ